MMSKLFYVFYISFFSLLYSSTLIDGPQHDGLKYKFSIDKDEVKGNDVIIKLKIDADIAEGWYMQSSNPDLCPSAPAEVSIDDSSRFNRLGEMLESPQPQIKYEKLFKTDIGKHYQNVF